MSKIGHKVTAILPDGRSLYQTMLTKPDGKRVKFSLGTPNKIEAQAFSEMLQEYSNDMKEENETKQEDFLYDDPNYLITKFNTFRIKCGLKPLSFNLSGESDKEVMTQRELLKVFLETKEDTKIATLRSYTSFATIYEEIHDKGLDQPLDAMNTHEAQIIVDYYRDGVGGRDACKGRTIASVEGFTKKARMMYGYAIHNRWTNIMNPFDSKKINIKKREGEEEGLARVPFTKEEVERLRNVKDPEWAMLCTLASVTAMRLGDAKSCGRDYFIEENGVLHLSWTPKKTERRKNAKHIKIPVVEPLLSMVKGKTDKARLFPILSKLTVPKLSKKFIDIMDEADVYYEVVDLKSGLKQRTKTFHCFRHYVNNTLREMDVSIEFRKYLCGHSDDDTNMLYSSHEIGNELNKINEL